MFRYWLSCIVIIFLDVSECHSQTLQQYVAQNISEVKTINSADTDQFEDLQTLGKAIGNARIVMLGEQDHGDAPSFLAKTRIICYLHKQLGFDVLAFESDFWALESLNKLPADGFSTDSLRNNTYKIWSKCVQVQPLYEYVAATKHTGRPLTFTGIDCRHAGSYSHGYYLQYLANDILPQVNLSPQQKESFLHSANDLLSKEFKAAITAADAEHFYKLCDTIAKQLPVHSFAAQDIQSLEAAARHAWWLDYRNPARDIQMAANLQWLAEYGYSGKKIIVWAHSMHVAKNLQLIPDKKTAPYNTSLGNETLRYFGKQLYVLGFVSYSGQAGSIGNEKYKVMPLKKNSFEQYAYETGYPFAFIDMQQLPAGTSFYMKGLSHIQSLKAEWGQVFDGILYIRDMYPCDER